MGKPTAMQQALGTGGAAIQRTNNPVTAGIGLNPSLGSQGVAGAQGGSVPGVDPAWSRIFGSATPSSLLDQRNANGGAMPSVTPQQPQLTAEPVGGAQTPASASTTNAMAPGALNGNTENGFSSTQQAGGQSNNERGTTSPMAQALTQPQVAETPISATPVEATPELAQGGVKQASQPRSAVATGAQSPTMVSEAPKGVADAGATGATYGTRGYHGINYTLNKPLPSGWAGLTDQARDAWLRKNATPTSPLQAEAGTVVEGMLGKNRHLPLEDPNGEAPVVLTPGMSEIDRANAIKNPTLSSMATQVMAFESRYGNAPQNVDFGGMPAKEKALFEAGLKEYNAFRSALATYGIYFPDNAPATGGGTGGTGGGTGGTGGTGGGGTGGTGGGTGGTGGTADDGPVNNEGPVTELPDGGTIGSPVDEYGPNFDIASPERGFDWYMAQYTKQGMDPLKAAVAAEAAFSAAQAQAQYNNRQSDVNISAGALNEFKGSDLYTGSQASALKMLSEGDPTPWDTIRNQYVSDQDKQSNQIVDAMSTGAARRGLSTGAMQGVQSDLLGQQANATNRGLGDLEIQKAASKRNYETQALQNALTTMGGTSGVALSGAYNVGSKVAGTAMDYGNPYQGYASGMANIDSMEAGISAAEEAGEFGVGEAVSILGQVAAAYFTGGASLAATGAAAAASGGGSLGV